MFDGTMMLAEAWQLTQVLLTDPSSQVAAATAGWRYPTSREALALADMWDLTFRVAAGKNAGDVAFDRPWDAPKRPARVLSQDRIRDELARRGHGNVVPLARRDARGRLHGPDGRFVAEVS